MLSCLERAGVAIFFSVDAALDISDSWKNKLYVLGDKIIWKQNLVISGF